MSEISIEDVQKELGRLSQSCSSLAGRFSEGVARWVWTEGDVFHPAPCRAEIALRKAGHVVERGSNGATLNGLDSTGRLLCARWESSSLEVLRLFSWREGMIDEFCLERQNLEGREWEAVFLSRHRLNGMFVVESLEVRRDRSKRLGASGTAGYRRELISYEAGKAVRSEVRSGYFDGSAESAFTRVYRHDESGALVAIDADDGMKRWNIFKAKPNDLSGRIWSSYAEVLVGEVGETVGRFCSAKKEAAFIVALSDVGAFDSLPILGVLTEKELEVLNDGSGMDVLNPAEWDDCYDVEELELHSIKLDDLVLKLRQLSLDESDIRRGMNDVAKNLRKSLSATGVGSKDMVCYATDLECVHLKESLIAANPKGAVKKLAKRLNFDLE